MGREAQRSKPISSFPPEGKGFEPLQGIHENIGRALISDVVHAFRRLPACGQSLSLSNLSRISVVDLTNIDH